MGEPSSRCHPSPDGCCLDFHETIVILVALIVVVQLALKLASVICSYLWYLVKAIFGMVFVKAPETSKATIAKGNKAHAPKPVTRWSEQDVPRHQHYHRRRQRQESISPHRRRCVRCTFEPLKVTMNLQNEPSPYQEHQRVGRQPYADYLPYHSQRYYNCDCETRPRPRTSSAPSGYTVTRYRDASCGCSDPILGAGGGGPSERRNTISAGTDPIPRQQLVETQYRSIGTGQDAEYPAITQRSHRPTKVYIYPVHPQTPPGSRSASPERLYRRRGGLSSSQDEQQEYDSRETRRKSRDVEQQTGPVGSPRYHNMSTSAGQGPMQTQTEPSGGKPRYYWSDQLSNADWVYRPLK